MLEIIEYNIDFKFKNINKLEWCDEFVMNEKWNYIKIKDIRTIEMKYMDKIPFNKHKDSEDDIILYNNSRWIYLNTKNNTGKTIINKEDTIEIPNLEIYDITKEIYISIYKFDFEFHTMITILQQKEYVNILEHKNIFLDEGIIEYKKLKIKIYENILSYTGNENETFREFYTKIEKIYNEEHEYILNIFNNVNKTNNKKHKSIAYNTWYKAERENQSEWPEISNIKIENSIEFPKNSGVYYYTKENNYIGLAKRNDYNIEKLIPKIYKTNHMLNEKSYLYNYIIKDKILEKRKNKHSFHYK